MEKRTVIAELISIANILDEQNLVGEADQITRIAQELASAPSFDYYGTAGGAGFEGPDDYRADELFNQADQYNDEQAFMLELARSEAMDRINEIKNLESPTEQDIAEYGDLLKFLEGDGQPESTIQNFAQNLSDGGADVHDPFADE